MKNTEKRSKVVIVGGGFAGIEIAKKLGKDPLSEVVLVSTNSYFQYYPNLYRLVVGATVNQVSIPLTNIVPRSVSIIIDTYTGIDVGQKTISLKSGATLPYDYIVMAIGSEPNYFGIDGMEAHSQSFLSVEKALGLKKMLLENIATAKTLPEAEAKAKLHTIIVGAGPSGTEMAGALQPFLVAEAKKVGVNPSYVTVDLLDSAPRVLAALPETASKAATEQLKHVGVTVYTNYGVNSCNGSCVSVVDKSTSDGASLQIEASTVIWTAGTKISSVFTTIPGVVMTDKKRVEVTAQLLLPSNDSIYVAGDGAGTLYSGLAQTAIDHGQYLAASIAARLRNKPVSDFVPRQGVFVIPIGERWALLNKKNFLFTGFTAYVMRFLVDARYFLTITTPWHVISMLRKDNS